MLFSSLMFVDSAHKGGGFTIPLGFFKSEEFGEKYHYFTFPANDCEAEPAVFATDYPYYRAAAMQDMLSSYGLSGEQREEEE